MANGRVGSVKLLTEYQYVLEYILTLKQVGCHIASLFFVHTVGTYIPILTRGKTEKSKITSQKVKEKDLNKQHTQHLN